MTFASSTKKARPDRNFLGKFKAVHVISKKIAPAAQTAAEILKLEPIPLSSNIAQGIHVKIACEFLKGDSKAPSLTVSETSVTPPS